MEEYGSITIDNKNLLNDLLGLESNDNHELTLYQPNQPAYMSSNQNNQSNYMPGQGRKFFLESPTFSKKEDDIYRYVHSRISNVDTSLNAGPNFQDSLDKIGEDQPRNTFSYNNKQFNKFSTDASTRIGSNRLLSDLAVASISKQNAPSNRLKNSEEPIYENELADSLEFQNNRPSALNHYPNSRPKQFQPLSPPSSQPLIENQYILQQQQQQIQQQQQQQQIQQQQQHQQQHQQIQQQQHQQQFFPYQGQPVIYLQSPTSQPIVNSSLQLNPPPQFIPINFQPTQLIPQQNMFYQEPVQPMFYNTAYPLIQNANYQNGNFYGQDEYGNSFQQQPYQILENRSLQNVPQNVTGTRYDAQPLQPPVPVPRSNKNISQQSNNDSYEMNTPEPDETELNNEFNQMRVNDNQSNNEQNMMERSDSRAQEYWVKLQKAKETRDKNSGLKKKMGSSNTLPSVGSYKSVSKKPPLPNGTNFLERNIESIRNKENLMHRYPEKKYEYVHGKNATERLKNVQGSPKKAPQHLQPLENFEDESNNFNSTKKISIPISSTNIKDQDHINVDINLRLVDLLPGRHDNRSYDDFDVQNDPLARYIRKFETNISRSLPGSSGSLNKLKPLPPLNKKSQKPFSHEGARLQHEYDNEIRNEEGYLAQLHKTTQKPSFKTYTLKDYRNYKKDALLNVANHTGKLGFDYESDAYKQKLESTLKKNDYAERVKIRNQILLAEQKKSEENSIKSQPVQEPSKAQRAREYVEKNVVRIKSASREIQQQISKSAPNERTKAAMPTKPVRNMPQKLDLSKKNRPQDTAIVKIRDPITSKLRTFFLNDEQIDVLSKRHQAEKDLVDKTIINKNRTKPYSPQKVEKPRQPIDLKDTKVLIEDNQNFDNRTRYFEIPVEPEKPKGQVNSAVVQNSNYNNIDDDNVDQLLERHNQEKNLVEQYENSYQSETYKPNDNQFEVTVE